MKYTDQTRKHQPTVGESPVVHLDGIPAVRVCGSRAQPRKARFIPPIPFDWDRRAVAAGSNAARIRTLVAYRYRTAREEWFTLPKGLLDAYEIDPRARRRGQLELAAAGLLEVRSTGVGRATMMRVLAWE